MLIFKNWIFGHYDQNWCWWKSVTQWKFKGFFDIFCTKCALSYLFFTLFIGCMRVTGPVCIKGINIIILSVFNLSLKHWQCFKDSICSRLAAHTSWQIQHLPELLSFKCSIKIFIFFNEIQTFYCLKEKKNYSFNVPAEHLSGWHLYVGCRLISQLGRV